MGRGVTDALDWDLHENNVGSAAVDINSPEKRMAKATIKFVGRMEGRGGMRAPNLRLAAPTIRLLGFFNGGFTPTHPRMSWYRK